MLSGSTQDYYIYADYTVRWTYSLIGATVPGRIAWRDWGLFLNGTGTGVINVGYTPPPAVGPLPATAPSSAQNQEYVGTITNVSGTTFTVTPTIPTGVTGQNVYHDQSIAIKAASDAACGARAGIVYFSGPEQNFCAVRLRRQRSVQRDFQFIVSRTYLVWRRSAHLERHSDR